MACEWGDFHFANALKRAFERRGHQARVDCQAHWNSTEAHGDEVVILLRGRHGYQPQPHQLNLLWLISHPDRVSVQELNSFDRIFVASKSYTEKLSQQVSVPVSCLYQCTDIEVFSPNSQTEAMGHEVLFVGNSRNVFRPIVRDALDGGIEVAVYGSRWEQFIPKSAIKGDYIPNELLSKAYSNCKILLNDHWETMKAEGFLSNRLFDASACGTFILSDGVIGLAEVFGEAMETYETVEELREKVRYYLEHQEERHQKALKARDIVLKHHTFDGRVEEILAAIDRLIRDKNSQSKLPLLDEFSQTLPLFYQKLQDLDDRQGELQKVLTDLRRSDTDLNPTLESRKTTKTDPVLVSIIMPTFNRRYIITEAIQSAIEQTHENWELLVCDDGSTDGTEEVVRNLKDNRIRYFKLPKANGSVARNVGLKHAKGNYISYLDSDNIWHPQHLQICLQNLKDDPVFRCSYTWTIDTKFEAETWHFKGVYCQSFDYYKLIERNFIDLNSFFHHRNVFEELGGFDENLLRLQDWDLLLRYLLVYPPKSIGHFTVLYRRNLAWKQVTNVFEKTNMRDLVQKKAMATLGLKFIKKYVI